MLARKVQYNLYSYQNSTEHLMEILAIKFYRLTTTSKLSVLLSLIVMALMLSGCAQQQHSLEVIDNRSGEFHGERDRKSVV